MSIEKIFLLSLSMCFVVISPTVGNATVIEFDGDGTITKFEAVDYLSVQRHTGLLKINRTKIPNDSGRYSDIIAKYSSIYDVNPDLVHAVIATESAYNSDALSPKGAEGLMQLMPTTAALYGIDDSFDADQNIKAGVHFLSDLLAKYEGDVQLTLAAYNAGPGAVTKFNGIPPYTETVRYIEKVESLLHAPDK